MYKPIARVDVDDIAFSSSLFSDKVDNTDGLNQLQIDTFGYMVQGSFLTHMYSVGRYSNVEAAAAEIERESLMQRILHDWIIYLGLVIYLPTQVHLTLTKIIKIVATR